MITDRTLAHLRTAAATTLLVPDVSVLVRVGERTVVEAARPPFEGADHPVLPVCAFHRSVVRAHELRRAGTRVEMVGLGDDLEPTVELRCSDAIREIPGGVLRRTGETWMHFCALSLPVDGVAAFGEEIAERSGVDVHLHADRSLDVTVVVTDTPVGDKASARVAVEVIEEIAACATVEALVELVQPSEPDWAELLGP